MKLFHVDSFTSDLFKGNPAGVVIVEGEALSDTLMMQIAAELKHSETAFVQFSANGISLRWFTPLSEVDLCGHATLATAHILWSEGYIDHGTSIQFQTKSGMLSAFLKSAHQIELNFPQLLLEPCAASEVINTACGITPMYTGKGDSRYLVEIDSREQLESLQVDYGQLKQLDRNGLVVTCRSDDPRYDFFSRYFSPKIGVPEDPVTGSAHCYLAPYWAGKLGKTSLVGFQCSARTGIIECELTDDERVLLSGFAKTFYKAELFV